MIKKTIRQTATVVACMAEIKSLNPALSRESEVTAFAFHEMAKDIKNNSAPIDWFKISKLDFHDKEVDYPSTRTITFEEQDFQIILQDFRNRLMVKKVNMSYLIKLVLLYIRDKVRKEAIEAEEFVQVEVTRLDAMELLRQVNNKAAAYIKAGKIGEIMNFLKEDDMEENEDENENGWYLQEELEASGVSDEELWDGLGV